MRSSISLSRALSLRVPITGERSKAESSCSYSQAFCAKPGLATIVQKSALFLFVSGAAAPRPMDFAGALALAGWTAVRAMAPSLVAVGGEGGAGTAPPSGLSP